jgi:glyoxylase-like metal-dependent hydrolase (beta-lactamase superfamily II)
MPSLLFATVTISNSGRVRLKAVETPGHTPESVSIAVYDLNASDSQPHAVLTGDTLFIGDVGRPDLRAALGWSAAELGGMLFDSVHAKLLALPDESLVYPAHGAGSLCGKAISKETVSTLGEQRRSNYALQPMSKEAFIQVTADQPEAPAYFNYDAVLNSQERPTLDQALAREMNPLNARRCAGIAGGRRATPRYARGRRIRFGASGGQHQHRPDRPIRDQGWNRARSQEPDFDYRGPWP